MSKKKSPIRFLAIDPSVSESDLLKMENGDDLISPLMKSTLNTLDNNRKINRLAFEQNPSAPNRYGGLYYDKLGLLPDNVIKRIALVDELVSTIIRLRGNQAAAFGAELQDRYSTGFRIEPRKNSNFEHLQAEEKARMVQEIRRVSKLLSTCGYTKKWSDLDQMSLSTFLYHSASNGVKFGRFATEIVWAMKDGEKVFYAFRPTDPGTIYKAIPHANSAEALRAAALVKLERLKNEKIDPERFVSDDYAWIQVVEGTPQQAFTDQEMVVHNCYPSTDIEFNGYPASPIDCAITAITTHINITTHNKLYFQYGRATKGMLVIESDNIDPSTIADLRQQFTATINSVENSHKLPVFKVGMGEKVTWQPIDSSSRDMEFQYLSDSNCRVILSAFHMSPEEIPGYNHLGKSTGAQTLSESSNEWKLESAQDVGLRPLLSNLEDFLNSRILPLLSKEVAEYCCIKLHGLEADTPEKEAAAIEKEQGLWGSINDTLRKVDKETIDVKMGGEMIMNPAFGMILDKYCTVGEIREYFLKIPDSAKDPKWDYARDQFFFSQQGIIQAKEQEQQQMQMAQEQMQAQQQSGQPQPGQEQQQQDPNQQPQVPADDGKDLTNGIDQVLGHLTKSEKAFTVNKRLLMGKQNAIVSKIMDEWHKESEKMAAELAIEIHKGKKK